MEVLKSQKIPSAQAVDKNGGEDLKEGDAELVIDATEDINKTIALFLAPSNITYIGTDTFLSWLASGSIVLRKDRNGKLRKRDVYVFHPIASAKYWKIPGANQLESRKILDLRQGDDRLNTAADMILYPEEYGDGYSIKKEDFALFGKFIISDNFSI